MKKIIIVVFVILAGYLSVSYFSTPSSGDSEGGITIILIDKEQNIISEETYLFESEITLFEFMQTRYDLGCANNSYRLDETCSFTMLDNHIILGIDDVVTDWTSSYIQIYIDDAPSEYGVDLIALKNNTTYTFKYVDLGGSN